MENMLRLASGAVREVVGCTMLPALVDRMIELDVSWLNFIQIIGYSSGMSIIFYNVSPYCR